MKKYLRILFAVIMATMLMCAVACDTQGVETDTSESKTETETETPTDEPTETETETQHVHDWTDADCALPKTCSDCGETEGEALGHTWADATCTSPKTCSVCSATEGEALGHAWTDATCTSPKTCSVCSVTEGEALGHAWVDATCTSPKTCSVCSVTEGEAFGHTWTDATCTEAITCSVCGETDGEALGHTGGEATCLGRAKCERCNKVYGNVGKHIYEGQVTTSEYLSTVATMVRPATYYYSCIYCGARGSKRFAYGGTIVEQLTGPYNSLFKEGNDGEGYLYFTDPHPVNCDFNAAFWSGREARLEKLAELYGYTNAEFAVCGGDWFNNSNSKESAIAMLEYIRTKTREWFGTCYLVVGNHDYNYQFVKDGTNGASEYWLSSEEIAAAWYPEYGKTYYTFATDVSRYYVFDSGIDWGHSSMTDLDKEQAEWYLEQLTANDDKHIVLMPHMIHISGSTDNFNPGTLEYAKISAAYNARESYTYNGVTYDFSEKTGMVEYFICGHNHSDYTGTIEGIPYILTATNSSGDPATADFVYADYEARKLYLTRVGNGLSREVDLLPVTETAE